MVADAPMKRAKSKSFSKDKSSKPSAEPTPGPSDDEEELIRCICGQYEEEEDVERDMICCDQCSAWQHNDCMGLSFPKGQEPDQYFCEGCKPENHKDLLERIAQGEKPWEEVAERRRKEAEDKKSTRRKRGRKGGRRGRPSESKTETSTPARSVKGQTPSSAPSVPPTGANVTPGQEENGHGDDVPSTDTPKRKFDEDQDSPQTVSVSRGITFHSLYLSALLTLLFSRDPNRNNKGYRLRRQTLPPTDRLPVRALLPKRLPLNYPAPQKRFQTQLGRALLVL